MSRPQPAPRAPSPLRPDHASSMRSRILTFLRSRPGGATAGEISFQCLHLRERALRDTILDGLVREGAATVRRESLSRGGRTSQVYSLARGVEG